MKRTQMDRRSNITKLITIDAMRCLLLIMMVILPEATAGFGFDSANSCSPNGKMSRRGRAQMLASIPCDLGKQAFCHLPGAAYPWHAVRRFVHENQGLMKRMYGDVRHISILRDEIQNNEVDEDDMEETAERYSKDGGRRSAKYLMHGRERDRDREDFGSFKGNDVLMEPHFRPVSTSTSSTTTTTKATTTTAAPITTSSTTDKAQSESSTTPENNSTSSTTSAPAPSSKEAEIEPEIVEIQPSLESNSVYEVVPSPAPSTASTTTTGAPSSSVGGNIEIIESPQLGLRNLSLEVKPSQEPTTAAPLKPTSKGSTNLPLRKRKPAEASTTVATPKAATTTAAPPPTTGTLLSRRNVTKSSPSPPGSFTTPVTFASLFSSGQFSVEKLRRPLTTSSTTVPAPASVGAAQSVGGGGSKPGLLREGQLFQDAMKQEPVAVASNLRGVNACPVKDEVVAPFWANNTRGEVLALLNLYPFEQYVHWEKCTHEFKQMFCRDGCRCEQQYRLHRLLAYDPHNECRGIFSDWFRFPSSCICKCYNIPMEFRATSRSPRSDSSFDAPRSDPIEAAEAEVQKAIYEHATEEWYRPRDEFDFLEG
ncbi:protein spaetzle 4 [Drosophila bipectinata]|uniref:protein spaetzle 4 n=1 Tax=Drosophila bipectinata TaxID=42026 RepID=UPI0038B3C0E0